MTNFKHDFVTYEYRCTSTNVLCRPTSGRNCVIASEEIKKVDSCTPNKDILIFYPGIENLILAMLSFPGCHVRANNIDCIGTHAHGRQVTSLLC